jgi:hypothetical protein
MKERNISTSSVVQHHLDKQLTKIYMPRPLVGEPRAGYPKGRSSPLVKGGVQCPAREVEHRASKASCGASLLAEYWLRLEKRCVKRHRLSGYKGCPVRDEHTVAC